LAAPEKNNSACHFSPISLKKNNIMKPKIITKNDFGAWVDSLIKKVGVVGVKEKEAGKFHFAPLETAAELRLDYDVTITPPKKFIQPPKEILLMFEIGNDKFKAKAVIEAKELVLLGVHPYDMKAINQMDKVFTDDNKETNYLERRKNITIIGVDPVNASKWGFWHDMGAATVDKGFDLWLTDLGDRYYVEAGSKQGEKLLSSAKTNDAGKTDSELQKEARLNLKSLCKPERKVKATVNELPSLFGNSYESTVWEEHAKKCYSCGSCNLVCPTCYCFDVREDVDISLKSGRRIRYWDGCLLEDFAMVGHGDNFREERGDRFRHRLFRKYSYMVDKVGDIACVGCGRCSSVCLPDITDPVKIINELKGGK